MDLDDEQQPAETVKQPVEMTAEELADEEWGPVKDKGKGKKGKKGKPVKKDESEDEEPAKGVYIYIYLATSYPRTQKSLCHRLQKRRTMKTRAASRSSPKKRRKN